LESKGTKEAKRVIEGDRKPGGPGPKNLKWGQGGKPHFFEIGVAYVESRKKRVLGSISG